MDVTFFIVIFDWWCWIEQGTIDEHLVQVFWGLEAVEVVVPWCRHRHWLIVPHGGHQHWNIVVELIRRGRWNRRRWDWRWGRGRGRRWRGGVGSRGGGGGRIIRETIGGSCGDSLDGFRGQDSVWKMIRGSGGREVEIGGGALEAEQCSVVGSSSSFRSGIRSQPYPCFLIWSSYLRDPRTPAPHSHSLVLLLPARWRRRCWWRGWWWRRHQLQRLWLDLGLALHHRQKDRAYTEGFEMIDKTAFEEPISPCCPQNPWWSTLFSADKMPGKWGKGEENELKNEEEERRILIERDMGGLEVAYPWSLQSKQQ